MERCQGLLSFITPQRGGGGERRIYRIYRMRQDEINSQLKTDKRTI
jgi:hypothetical protein